MRLAIFGGNGYIGSIMARLAVAGGYEVTVIDNNYFGNHATAQYDVIEKNLDHLVPEDLEGVDHAVFLAGLSNDPMADFNAELNYNYNAVDVDTVAMMCKLAGVKRLTYASSASIYDIEDDFSLDERHEKTYVYPTRNYSLTKYLGEKILLARQDADFKVCLLRQGTVYGQSPRMRYDLVVNAMTKNAVRSKEVQCHNGGEQGRPLVSVEDVARAHLHLLGLPDEQFNGELYNITGENILVKDVAVRVQEALPDIKITNQEVDQPVRNYYMDDSKLRATGFEFRTDMLKEIRHMANNVKDDCEDSIYYNIKHMEAKPIFS